MTSIKTALLVVLAVLATSCADENEPRPSVPTATMRDSAGVSIVENAPLAEMGLLSWSLADTPTTQVGELEGSEAYQLFRVADAHLRTDGSIVIADGGSQQIRVFDRNGEHVASWGQRGEGPGEFTLLTQIDAWPGDSLIAWDGRLRRLSVLDHDGALGRTLTLQARENMSSFGPVHVLSSGSVIATGTALDLEEPQDGMIRPPITAAYLDDRGETVVSFGLHPGSEAYLRSNGEMIAITRAPIQRSSHTAVWGARLVIAPTDAYSLPVFDDDGALTSVVRVRGELRPVTQQDIDREINALVERTPEAQQARRRAAFEGVPFPTEFPAFGSLETDADGNLWVQDFRPPSQEGPDMWTIFGPDGQALGRFETPENLTIYEIGADYVLGRTTDQLDVERVVLLGFERKAP